MKKNDFIKIINEEISNFDFLSNDEFLEEQEITDLLQNIDLQKQFICDSLLDKTNKVKIKEITDSSIIGNWNETSIENANGISLRYYIDIEYKYDINKESIIFTLNFDADKIDIGVNGWYNPGNSINIEPEGETWYDVFDWDDIIVSMYTINGDDIEFTAFEKAPPKIQILFMRHYLEGFIETETLEIRTNDMKDNVLNTTYC